MKPIDRKIYLASKSPRRRELLRQIGVEFELLMLRDNAERGADVSEAVRDGEPAQDYVERIAREKGDWAQRTMRWRRLPARPILSADTTVTIDGRILGKPADAAEAAAMLQALSGRTHLVMTSVSLHHEDEHWQATQISEVTFATLPGEAIRAYCATAEPYDKAGGYGIQGAAAAFIARIAGSYSGIMGLPLHETAQLLQHVGIRLP